MAEFELPADYEPSECESDLESAIAAIETIKKGDLTELKSLANPPKNVKHVMTMVNMLMSGVAKPRGDVWM